MVVDLYITLLYNHFLHAADDTTKLNTPGNLYFLLLIPPLVGVGVTVVGLILAKICKKKAEQSNMPDRVEVATQLPTSKERCV